MELPNAFTTRILSEVLGEQKRYEGYKKADLHVHSSCSIDVLPTPEFHPETVYQKALNMGMDYISITDHDTVEAYDIIGWEREKLVPAVELSIKDNERVGHTIHTNVYELNKTQFFEMQHIAEKDRNILTLVEYFKDQGLPYTYNHPFWFAQGEKPNYQAVCDLVELFPVLEYNFKRIKKKNYMALWLAAKHGKGIICNTDTHIANIGEIYTLSKGDTFGDWFQNLIDGDSYIVPKDMETDNLTEEMQTWIQTIFDMKETAGKTLAYTKNMTVDNFINFIANSTSEDHPRILPLLRSCFCGFAKTGLLPYFYVKSQNRIANKIERLLQITG